MGPGGGVGGAGGGDMCSSWISAGNWKRLEDERMSFRGGSSCRRNWRGSWRGGRGRGGRYVSSRKNETTPGVQLVQRTLSDCPYSFWARYFPNQAYSNESTTTNQVKAFECYFRRVLTGASLDDIFRSYSLPVDAMALLQDSGLVSALPNLSELLQNNPEEILNGMALALHAVLLSLEMEEIENEGEEAASEEGGTERAEDRIGTPQENYKTPRYYIRLYNFGPITSLKNIKASLYGKCVSVQGTVVRVGNIKPVVTTLAFCCTLCQEMQAVVLPSGKYTQPTKCSNGDCRGRNFTAERRSPLTEIIDWQTIKIQELSDDYTEAGRIPRTIECELTADLVDTCVPGDMVTITGVVKANNSEEASRGQSSKDKCMFLLYLQGISVSNSKRSNAEDPAQGFHMEFSTKDYYAISEIHSDKNVFKLIVGSMCPAICGHEMVKAGLVLGLFGGSQRFADMENTIPIRGDPHILVVGDPGLGKSQMLQAASNIAPRGVYVCGNTSTTSGLTVTLVKESNSGAGEFAIEAGALVLADQGCCCIDEFDKMGSQHQALLEAMEQQSISIAKAGVVCNLPARTSILAAANPIGGHYNRAKTVSENLKMNSALLSRFDLVFILLDRPDDDMDCLLSEHVMSLHSGGGRQDAGNRGGLRATARRNKEGGIDTSLGHGSSILVLEDGTGSLQERLRVRQGENFDPVPYQLLRKYVGYARKYVHPKLGDEAGEVLKKFYLELRKQRQSSDSTPITTRQLESLIRLTEARARLELREEATAQDASEVVEIMKFSMNDTFSDQYGMLDFSRSQHGSGMSQKAQGKKLVSALGRVSDLNGCSTFTVQQMRDIAKRIGLQMGNFEDLIYSLNNQNYLLKKGPRLYQLQTASCL